MIIIIITITITIIRINLIKFINLFSFRNHFVEYCLIGSKKMEIATIIVITITEVIIKSKYFLMCFI